MTLQIGSKFSEWPAANPALPVDLVGLQEGKNVRTTLINPVCEDGNGLITVVTVEATDIVTMSLDATNITTDDLNVLRINAAEEVILHRGIDNTDYTLLHTGNFGQFLNGTFVWEQLVALPVWTIIHNLKRKPPVTVVDLNGDKVEADIKYLSIDIIQITHGVPFSGIAYLN